MSSLFFVVVVVHDKKKVCVQVATRCGSIVFHFFAISFYFILTLENLWSPCNKCSSINKFFFFDCHDDLKRVHFLNLNMNVIFRMPSTKNVCNVQFKFKLFIFRRLHPLSPNFDVAHVNSHFSNCFYSLSLSPSDRFKLFFETVCHFVNGHWVESFGARFNMIFQTKELTIHNRLVLVWPAEHMCKSRFLLLLFLLQWRTHCLYHFIYNNKLLLSMFFNELVFVARVFFRFQFSSFLHFSCARFELRIDLWNVSTRVYTHTQLYNNCMSMIK